MTQSTLNRFAILMLLTVIFSSCKYEQIELPDELPQNVSFQTELIPIFNQSCNAIGCHNVNGIWPDLSEGNAFEAITTGGQLDLDTPENSKLYMRMIDLQSPMPLSGILSKTQTDKVLVWIREGANNN
ncbi:MAG: hypothetical protein J7K39_10545 [Bacteroidales bacterium]|nr:hypothetical protein [Bacteroidales bacterium]